MPPHCTTSQGNPPLGSDSLSSQLRHNTCHPPLRRGELYFGSGPQKFQSVLSQLQCRNSMVEGSGQRRAAHIVAAGNRTKGEARRGDTLSDQRPPLTRPHLPTARSAA